MDNGIFDRLVNYVLSDIAGTQQLRSKVKPFENIITEDVLRKMAKQVVEDPSSNADINQKLNAIEKAFDSFEAKAQKLIDSRGEVGLLRGQNPMTRDEIKENFSDIFEEIVKAAGLNSDKFNRYFENKLTEFNN